MALLIDTRSTDWMGDAELRDLLAPLLPGVTVHCGPAMRPMPDVVMLATIGMKPGMVDHLPNLRLVQKLGAGVETMLSDPALPPHIRIARLEPTVQAAEMAEYALAYALLHMRKIQGYLTDQAGAVWAPKPPRRAAETRVSVLGLGHIGACTARLFRQNGFQVSGWSRTQKSLGGIACHAGVDGLRAALTSADVVVAVLPSTPDTRGFVDAPMIANMKPGTLLINMGRGDLVVERDLLAALDTGQLGGAVLDVFTHEPLPAKHPYWTQKGLIVTPHVSGWSVDDGLPDIAKNYHRLLAGNPLLREVDRKAGY